MWWPSSDPAILYGLEMDFGMLRLSKGHGGVERNVENIAEGPIFFGYLINPALRSYLVNSGNSESEN